MFSAKLFLFLALSIAIAAAVPSDYDYGYDDYDYQTGGVQNLSGDELQDAEETLQNSLTKLAAGDGPNYTISEVKWATHQVVSGSLYKYNVDLIDGDSAVKNCNVQIWSQAWLENGIEVTFECEGEEKVVKAHSE